MASQLQRCWRTDNPLHIKYHDEEWGVPVHDDRTFYEYLVLGGFQAGLTWWLILQRREDFRQAFANFDPAKVATYTADDVQRLMTTGNIVHNKMKIKAAVNNATKFLQVQSEFSSFDRYIWRFVDGKTITNSYVSLEDLPAETAESKAMSVDLKARGFQFVGPTICYAFMQATGLVNDHLTGCFRHRQLQDSNR